MDLFCKYQTLKYFCILNFEEKGKEMKRKLIILLLSVLTLSMQAQESVWTKNSPFRCRIDNEEYHVWMTIDFIDNSIKIPLQEEIFGNVPGYIGSTKDTRKWIITDAEVKDNVATLSIINDYGSEDLTATLTLNKDGSYTLKQEDGATIKMVENRKWVKLPKKLVFKSK